MCAIKIKRAHPRVELKAGGEGGRGVQKNEQGSYRAHSHIDYGGLTETFGAAVGGVVVGVGGRVQPE